MLIVIMYIIIYLKYRASKKNYILQIASCNFVIILHRHRISSS